MCFFLPTENQWVGDAQVALQDSYISYLHTLYSASGGVFWGYQSGGCQFHRIRCAVAPLPLDLYKFPTYVSVIPQRL